MGSPFYGSLLAYAAADIENGGVVQKLLRDGRGENTRAGVRLMAALHNLALSGKEPALAEHFPSTGGDGDAQSAWRCAALAIERNFEEVTALFDAIPQTNEPARAMLLSAAILHAIAQRRMPVRLFEIGASAALNARLDAFSYDSNGVRWGDPSSVLTLRNRIMSGEPNHVDEPLVVVERRACDLHPLDIESDDDCRFLQSYVWADQVERFDRLRRGIAAARALPVRVDAMDALQWMKRSVAVAGGALTVVMHSAMLEHVSPAERAGIEERIHLIGESATDVAPFAWVRMEEADGRYETRVTLWPNKRETLIATSNGHAQGIRWS